MNHWLLGAVLHLSVYIHRWSIGQCLSVCLSMYVYLSNLSVSQHPVTYTTICYSLTSSCWVRKKEYSVREGVTWIASLALDQVTNKDKPARLAQGKAKLALVLVRACEVWSATKPCGLLVGLKWALPLMI